MDNESEGQQKSERELFWKNILEFDEAVCITCLRPSFETNVTHYHYDNLLIWEFW
jgi:hypothetical protein